MIQTAKLVRSVAITLIALIAAGCASPVTFTSLESSGMTPQQVGGSLVRPKGKGPFPAVVLLHTCGGVSVKDLVWAETLANAGYVALVVNSFGSRGADRCPVEFSGTYEMMRDAYGALDYLAGLPEVDGDRVGVMGFSLGGNAIDLFVSQPLKSSAGRNFKAAVNAYGRCDALEEEVKFIAVDKLIPTMVVIGDKENYYRLRSCLKLIGKSPMVTVHILKGVYHAFDNPIYGDLRTDSNRNPMLYDAGAATRLEELTKAFFARHLR